MIWATVSSQSCFCWLYRASPSLAAKNIINLISILTISWCPCIDFSFVVGRVCLLGPVHSLGKILLAFALLRFYSKAKYACYSRYLLTSYHCIPVPCDVKDIFFGVSSRKSCKSTDNHSTPASPALVVGARLGLLWYWMVCLGNE